MKNSFVLLTLLFISSFVTSCNKDVILSEQDTPSEIKNYVATHFPNCTISRAIKEPMNANDMYEIHLSCGCTLEFNKQKNITDIDCPSQLPSSVIPNTILAYVSANYPNNHIISWELQRKNQSVELNNDTTLVFDLQGNFLRVED